MDSNICESIFKKVTGLLVLAADNVNESHSFLIWLKIQL